MRYRDLENWRNEWLDPCVCGGEPEREALHAFLAASLDIECAHLKGEDLIAAFLDYAKFFDSMPWELLFKLAEWWGMPPGILKSMRSLYNSMLSYFRINGHYGEAWGRTNGFAQGCSLSILFANMFGSLWAKIMTNRAPAVRNGFHR